MKLLTYIISTCLLLVSFAVKAEEPFVLDFGSEHDSTSSAVFTGKVSTEFFQKNAMAFEVGFGKDTLRTNMTYGLIVGDNNYFKVTDDFLYQNRVFDFGQVLGKHKVKAYQNAVGAAYLYDLDDSFFKGFETSVYYSYAPSQTVSVAPVPFTYSGLDDGKYQVHNFHGRLAGATAWHSDIVLSASPLKNSLVRLGVDYDLVTFDNKWDKQRGDKSFGGHIEAEKVIFSWLKTAAHYRFLSLTNSYGHSYSVYLPSPKDIQFELVGDVSYQDDSVLNNSYWLAKATLRATVWGSNAKPVYTIGEDRQDLREWVAKPVVRMHDVLVMPENRGVNGAVINTYWQPPSNAWANGLTKESDSQFIRRADGQGFWFVSFSDANKFAFYKATYRVETGFVKVYYRDTATENKAGDLLLTYAGDPKEVQDVVGLKWDTTTSTTMYTCTSTAPSDCKFKVPL